MFYSAKNGGFYPSADYPNCPQDLVKITAAEHLALLAGQSAGKIIAPDASGRPVLRDRAVPQPSSQSLCSLIDDAADSARARVAGDPLRAVEYDLARQEAEAFAAAGYQGEVPRMVAAWAISGRTPRQAADSILAEAAAYTEALYLIRETRLQAKERIRGAMEGGDLEYAQACAAQAVAAIGAAVFGVGNNAEVQ